MNRPLRILAISVVALIVGCASRDNQIERPYIGTWYAQGRDPSITWKLDKGGDFGEAHGFVTPDTDKGNWSFEDGELILVRKHDGDRAEQRLKATVVGNTMTVNDPSGPLIFTRIAK